MHLIEDGIETICCMVHIYVHVWIVQ